MGHDAAIVIATSQGQLEPNVCKPLIAPNVQDSTHLLADAMRSFTAHCVANIGINAERMEAYVQSALMLVTAQSPHIGCDRAARIAKHAHAEGSTLREAALDLGLVSAEQSSSMAGCTRGICWATGSPFFRLGPGRSRAST